ncbi:helix-turn-helix domain-containing protein [Pseudoneobacillus sp. C159]
MKNKNKIVYIGPTLKRIRDEKGLSQEELAGNSNLNRTYIGELENNGSRASIDTMFQLAYGLGIEPFEFIKVIQKDNPDFMNKIEERKEKE